jgi:alpha-amylase
MKARFHRLSIAVACFLGTVLSLRQCEAGDVILQYFEGRYATMTRRVPDIFAAGYRAVWIPPTNRAEGGQSAGYDVFDRFDVNPFYGTDAELREFIAECKKANIRVFVDIVLNHNAYANLSTPDFVGPGKPDYPGFVLTLNSDIDGDFHGGFESGELNGRINGGLIDIAHEKNHRFIRQPVTDGDARNIPNEKALKSNRKFYPDIDRNSPAELGDTSGDRHSPSGFNLDRPEAGDPEPENATGYLMRYCQWMVEVMGVDGFRLDAVRHCPTFFWNDFYDNAVKGKGPNGSTPFSFGEVSEEHNFDLLRSYSRKDNIGNRDLLDFRLHYIMKSIFNAEGFGDMRLLEGASVDAIDGDANDGSRGVTFVSNHDAFAGPPKKDNIAHAHLLSRTGFPIIYYNALELGNGRDFPIRGRGDALGGKFGDRITKLVDINREYVRGRHITRLTDNDVYLYERDQSLIVGLNDNQTFDADRNIQTSFPGGTELVELTGNARATNPLTINADGTANVTIPHNDKDSGFAMWGPRKPHGKRTVDPLVLSPVESTSPADPPTEPDGKRRLTAIDRVTADSVNVELTLEDEGLDDNAIVRVDNGRVNVIGTPIFGGGEFKGYQTFTNSDPGTTGSAKYSAKLDITKLANGVHYIEVLAFLRRNPGEPPVFETFRKVIAVDR